MNRILVLGAKELKVTARSKTALFWILVFPTIFAIFFGVVMSGNSGKQARMDIAVVDQSKTKASETLLASLRESTAVRLIESIDERPITPETARDRVRQGKVVAFLLIPDGYGAKSQSMWTGSIPIELGVDPSRTAEAGMLEGVIMQSLFSDIGSQFTDPKKALANAQETIASIESANEMPEDRQRLLKNLMGSLIDFSQSTEQPSIANSPFSPEGRIKKVDIARDTAGRPRSQFELTFASAITWGMYGCIVTFAISIVSERANGTLTRLRMTPLSSWELIAGKGLACFAASVAVAFALILLAMLLFKIQIGSPFHLCLAIASAAFCYTGLMMALAGLGNTAQDVSGAASGIFMPMAMIGGAMIPRMFMPSWMQSLSVISPVRWNVEALEGAIWRQYSIGEMAISLSILLFVGAIGFIVGTIAISRKNSSRP
jgi:ABC-2 type transport system permease protein